MVAIVTVTATLSSTPNDSPISYDASSVCLPSNLVVIMEDKGPVETNQLRIGDSVLTGGSNYSPVIALMHNESDFFTKFLRVHTALGYSLLLSDSHYISTTNRAYQTG